MYGGLSIPLTDWSPHLIIVQIKKVAAGGTHNLVSTSLGVVLSWGGGESKPPDRPHNKASGCRTKTRPGRMAPTGAYGQLGNGHLWDKAMPQVVNGVTGVQTLVAGRRHSLVYQGTVSKRTCGRELLWVLLVSLTRCSPDNGEVWAWGWNGFGELGLGDVAVKLQPYCLFAFKRAKVLGVSHQPQRVQQAETYGPAPRPTASDRRVPVRACKVWGGERHSVVATGGIAVKVVDEEDYKPYFKLLEESGNELYVARLKKTMRADNLVGAYLEHRNALVPGAYQQLVGA